MVFDLFFRKRLLVVVAHQDDESLYLGGLLSLLVGRCDISIVSTTAPMQGRADTDHRSTNFRRVGRLLGCRKVWCLHLPDCGPRGDAYATAQLTGEIATQLAGLDAQYDVVLTHGVLGEPNRVYGGDGHEAHKATHLAVSAALRLPIVECGLGDNNITFEVQYDCFKKKALLDCYAPWWTPAHYDFTYKPERYVVRGGMS